MLLVVALTKTVEADRMKDLKQIKTPNGKTLEEELTELVAFMCEQKLHFLSVVIPVGGPDCVRIFGNVETERIPKMLSLLSGVIEEQGLETTLDSRAGWIN
jgi:hypothetical protein